MSSATKRKHVTRDVVQNFTLPQDDETIVQVVAGRGNNLHEVRRDTGETFLVSMPTKFRKNVWIKRGDFVVVKPIEEGDKVKAEILTILYKEQIKYIKAENQWPAGFEAAKVEEEEEEEQKDKGSEEEEQKDKGSEEEEGDSEDDSDLFQNTNRPIYSESESSDETESEEEK